MNLFKKITTKVLTVLFYSFFATILAAALITLVSYKGVSEARQMGLM